MLASFWLYIFWILHQTTTSARWLYTQQSLYIFWILHQTTTYRFLSSARAPLYIFWILHQTTTPSLSTAFVVRCISFESYIKPQPALEWSWQRAVVYLLNPTSNHNCSRIVKEHVVVVYLLNPTSNHNLAYKVAENYVLYIFWILHQTTTISATRASIIRCISFESYIKPQLAKLLPRYISVVYLLNPTSNHNTNTNTLEPSRVVYLLNPTSNHNYKAYFDSFGVLYIFWILHQTTTLPARGFGFVMLYIFWILHQTTTRAGD